MNDRSVVIQAFLDKSYSLFSKYGIKKIRARKVVPKNYSTYYIYACFGSMDSLRDIVVDRCLKELEDQLKQIDIGASLYDIDSCILEFLGANKGLRDLIASEHSNEVIKFINDSILKLLGIEHCTEEMLKDNLIILFGMLAQNIIYSVNGYKYLQQMLQIYNLD